MEEGLIGFKEAFHIKPMDAGMYSPLVLAYIGDAVYEIMIRTKVVNEGNEQVNKLQKKSAALVKAGTQAKILMEIEDELTETEHAVYKRGRNAKSASMAKNATMKEYRMATGFEALVGYLYLSEQYDRLAKIVALGLSRLGAFTEEKETCDTKNLQ